MNVETILQAATYDRFAMILDCVSCPELEKTYRELAETLTYAARVTGVLVQKKGSRVFFHKTKINNLSSILENGLQPCTTVGATYSDGMIYAYPTTKPFEYLSGMALLEIEYEGEYLEALYTDDKPEELQGECLLRPECIKKIHRINI